MFLTGQNWSKLLKSKLNYVLFFKIMLKWKMEKKNMLSHTSNQKGFFKNKVLPVYFSRRFFVHPNELNIDLSLLFVH